MSTEAPPEAELRNCRSRGEGTAPIKMEVRRTDMRIALLCSATSETSEAWGRLASPIGRSGRSRRCCCQPGRGWCLRSRPKQHRSQRSNTRTAGSRRSASLHASSECEPTRIGGLSGRRRSFPSALGCGSAWVASRLIFGSTVSHRPCAARCQSVAAAADPPSGNIPERWPRRAFRG